jgi:hypothetical protein
MSPNRVRGVVINVHALGATVRVDDGRLMSAPIGDVNAHRAAYSRAVGARTETLPFDVTGPRQVVLATTRVDEPIVPTAKAPALADPALEEQITQYLKSTQEWAPPDLPEPFERHLFRKRQRAKLFRGDGT